MRALAARAMSLSREEMQWAARFNVHGCRHVPYSYRFRALIAFSSLIFVSIKNIHVQTFLPVSSHSRWIQYSQYTIHTAGGKPHVSTPLFHHHLVLCDSFLTLWVPP
jgi:hypothetical protein